MEACRTQLSLAGVSGTCERVTVVSLGGKQSRGRALRCFQAQAATGMFSWVVEIGNVLAQVKHEYSRSWRSFENGSFEVHNSPILVRYRARCRRGHSGGSVDALTARHLGSRHRCWTGYTHGSHAQFRPCTANGHAELVSDPRFKDEETRGSNDAPKPRSVLDLGSSFLLHPFKSQHFSTICFPAPCRPSRSPPD
jgi:hypothetical protein